MSTQYMSFAVGKLPGRETKMGYKSFNVVCVFAGSAAVGNMLKPLAVAIGVSPLSEAYVTDKLQSGFV